MESILHAVTFFVIYFFLFPGFSIGSVVPCEWTTNDTFVLSVVLSYYLFLIGIGILLSKKHKKKKTNIWLVLTITHLIFFIIGIPLTFMAFRCVKLSIIW